MDETDAPTSFEAVQSLVEAAPIGMALFNVDGSIGLVNAHFCRIADVEPDQAVGGCVRLVWPLIADEIEPLIERVVEKRVAVEADHTVSNEGGSPATLLHATYFPVDAEVPMVGVVLRDVTSLTNSDAQFAARQRMADSVTSADNLSTLEETIVRWARIIPSAVAAHLTSVDPETNQLNLAEITSGSVSHREADPDTDGPMLLPFEAGEWTIWRRAELIEQFGQHDWLQDSTAMIAGCALTADSESAVGTLTWQLTAELEPESTTWELMQSIAATAAAALITMERSELDRRLALAYQRSLLPESLPTIDGLELAADYRSAMDPDRSGGDWYDVVRRRDGATVLIVGDAVGHGIDAAVNMGHVRDVARSAALELSTPDEVLTQVDRHIKELGEDSMAAMTVVVVAAGECVVSVALAASPPAVLRGSDGATELLDPAPGPFVGSPLDARYTSVDRDLDPGAMVVLLTDGLIESPDRDPDDGLRAVMETVGEQNGSVGDICTRLLDMIDESEAGDDIVVLAARRNG